MSARIRLPLPILIKKMLHSSGQVASAQRWAIGWTLASYATCGTLDYIGYKPTVSLIFNEWTTGWNIGVSVLSGFLISAFNIGLLEGFVPQRFRDLWDTQTLRTSLFFACSSAVFAANQWGTYRTLGTVRLLIN
jgi:hypothetical protein